MKSPQNNCLDALYRAAQHRIERLEHALQDVYSWAYSDGELPKLDEIMEGAAVPIPDEIVTRNRMIEVWKEGFETFHGWTIPPEEVVPERELTVMLHHASQMYSASVLTKGLVRENLWEIARAASNLLSPDLDVLSLALEEYDRAAQKHPGMTLECGGHTDATRLFALVEEIGEVAACLTYDNDAETGHGSDLQSEVIQVIALALAWATCYLND